MLIPAKKVQSNEKKDIMGRERKVFWQHLKCISITITMPIDDDNSNTSIPMKAWTRKKIHSYAYTRILKNSKQ